MKESIKTVFQCDFCDKRLFRKHAMINHEKLCNQNPLNYNKCDCCAFCEKIEVKFSFQGYYDGHSCQDRKGFANGFRCTKLNKEMYPHKAVKMGVVAKYPETFEGKEKMPNQCEHFEIIF